MKRLPPEIWQLVVNQLEREDQKACRTLSKLHHDLATSALFAHVIVYFGLWIDGTPIDWSKEAVAEVELKNAITWDILRHISLCPDFAMVVKKITVRAYLSHDEESAIGGHIFYTRPLIAALQALRNLRAFHWHGSSPQLRQDVLTALAQSSGHSLKELHIPITNPTATCLSAFCSLQELRSVDVRLHHLWSADDIPMHPPNAQELWHILPMSGLSSSASPLDEGSTRALQKVVDGAACTLTRITMSGDVLWGCSMRSMLGLQELEVILPETAGGLALVLRHCSLLRSLTIHPLALDELFSVLEADPTALPDLRAFKFIHSSTTALATSQFEYRHAQSLARFIENKKKLACLDVELDVGVPGGGEIRCDEPILEAIAGLPRLEVLGFSFIRAAWIPGDIQLFHERIPQGLTALRLSVYVEQADNDILLQEWLDLLKGLTSLRYLHVLDRFRTLDLKQQLLEDPPISLELVGYGPFLRWLVQGHDDPDDDRLEYSPSWPLSKVKFRSADDFGCAEWEWLLRWHGAFDINDLAPGLFNWSGAHLTGFL